MRADSPPSNIESTPACEMLCVFFPHAAAALMKCPFVLVVAGAAVTPPTHPDGFL